jgi:hypothetical protein
LARVTDVLLPKNSLGRSHSPLLAEMRRKGRVGRVAIDFRVRRA